MPRRSDPDVPQLRADGRSRRCDSAGKWIRD